MTHPTHQHPAEKAATGLRTFHMAHGHGGGAHHHFPVAEADGKASPDPRFSLIALSALQRLALVMPAILVLMGLALWATHNG
jgi:hypothetical protein